MARKSRRRMKRRKSRKSRRRRRGGSTNPAVMALVDIFYKPPPKVARVEQRVDWEQAIGNLNGLH